MDRVVCVSVVRDFAMYERCIGCNAFLEDCERLPVDNVAANNSVGVCYNRVIGEFDFKRPAWIVFCHEDWEAKEPLRPRLAALDRNSLWGVIGAVTVRRFGFYAQWRLLGGIEECRKDGSNLRRNGEPVVEGTRVDTFDCQFLAVHSSLVERLNLRFDERLTFDLYVEDFCIAAHERGGVVSRILPFVCRHWSVGRVLPRYAMQEMYLNEKWKSAGSYTGTSSLILGGTAPWWWRFSVFAKKCIRRKKRGASCDSYPAPVHQRPQLGTANLKVGSKV